jgi:thiol-disulfide isomerase/thioredoxin
MAERLLILTLGIVLAWTACAVWRLWQQRRLRTLTVATAPQEVARIVDGRRPALLYFTTPECAQCRLQQAPILNQLAAKVDIAIHKLDAVEQETLARFYGIMTVPTTIILDAQLRPVAVNHGVAPLQRLQAQIEAIGADT